jgi:hypothetical protein
MGCGIVWVYAMDCIDIRQKRMPTCPTHCAFDPGAGANTFALENGSGRKFAAAVEVSSLMEDGASVEIEVTAVIPE